MAGMTKIAVVRFLEEGRQSVYISHVNNILDFYPRHAKDYVPKKDYLVKWEKSFHGVDGDHSGRYPAEILLLGVSDAEVKLKFKQLFPRLKITGTIPSMPLSPKTVVPSRSQRKADTRISTSVQPAAKIATKSLIGDASASSSAVSKDHSQQRKDATPVTPISAPVHSTNKASTKPRKGDQSGSSSDVSKHRKEQGGNTVPSKTKEYLELERQSALIQLKLARMRKASPSEPTIPPRVSRAPSDDNEERDDDDSVPGSNENFGGYQTDGHDLNDWMNQNPGHDEDYFGDNDDFQENNDDGLNKDRGNDDGKVDEQVEEKNGDTDKNPVSDLEDEELTDDEIVTQRIARDLKGESLLAEKDKNKVYIGKKCIMKKQFWELKVRTAKGHSKFVRTMAFGLWGAKKLLKRNLTGKVRGTTQKQKATPRKVACALAAYKGYLIAKNEPEAVFPSLMKQARKNLADKFGDCGRDNDPEYRTKVKKWNNQKKERMLQKRAAQATNDSSTDDSDGGEN